MKLEFFINLGYYKINQYKECKFLINLFIENIPNYRRVLLFSFFDFQGIFQNYDTFWI